MKYRKTASFRKSSTRLPMGSSPDGFKTTVSVWTE